MLSNLTIRASLLVALLVGTPCLAADVGETYHNERFGFHLVYPPKLLRAGPESEDGGRRTFEGSGDAARLQVWGMSNAVGATPAELAVPLRKQCTSAVRLGPSSKTLATLSCRIGAQQMTEKIIASGNQLAFLRLTYPVRRAGRWRTPAAALVASFTFDPPVRPAAFNARAWH
ncbi:hypothetical protein [Chitinasiproducens palmae]|uniref:Uncharacterized protein n=1 Tax=Chitinasiproducens palmae TaxID=1770053 RepID=A0A1H2PU43_9BURK|nr:hypothetical protein [Chitinasiproducens palmae]SDV50308.1 hypothetical protein SAMN05216551_11181 [Chitinasiproducens palmae]